MKIKQILICFILIVGCRGDKKESPQSKPSVEAQVEKMGDLKCHVFLDGVTPARAIIKMDADRKCMSMHKEAATSQSVLVNNEGMLQNVFVYVKEGLGTHTFSSPTAPIIIDQRGCMYEPHVLGIQVNQPLLIRNSDPVLHNIHALPTINSAFNIAQPLQGMKTERVFSQPEIMIRVKCEVHSWMGCYIGVLDHPFFAVTDSDGNCILKGLPAGEYTIAAWHEKYGSLEQSVVIAGAAAKAIDFRFKGS